MNNFRVRMKNGIAVVGLVSLLTFPLAGIAATVTTDADTTITLPNGVNLTLLDGALFGSLTVNSSTIDIVLESDTSVTLRNSSRYRLDHSGDGTALTSCADTYSQIVLTATGAGTATITPEAGVVCSSPPGGGPSGGGGGGGGGGGSSLVIPSNTSVVINGGATETARLDVTLTLAATGANEMLISNDSTFAGSDWEPYATAKNWVFSGALGSKTVYVKFRSSGGGMSGSTSNTIKLVSSITKSASGEISSSDGGTVGLTDNSIEVSVPAGALSGSAVFTVTATSSLAPAPSGNSIVGNRGFDITAIAGSTPITAFNKIITLTFRYSNDDIQGLDEASLEVYYWDTATSEWKSLGGTVNQDQNSITASTDHLTLVAIMGQESDQSSDVTIGEAGELVSLACPAGADVNDSCKAVYYLGADGKRYVFPNQKTFDTWYDSFADVRVVSLEELSTYAIGGNVTYRPGVKLIKVDTDPKVYAVNKNGALHWVQTEALANQLYGVNWAQQVEDIPVSFFINYRLDSDVATANDYNPTAAKAGSPTINANKGL